MVRAYFAEYQSVYNLWVVICAGHVHWTASILGSRTTVCCLKLNQYGISLKFGSFSQIYLLLDKSDTTPRFIYTSQQGERESCSQ